MSCKKETGIDTPCTSQLSQKQQVAQIIQKADPMLYDKMYGNHTRTKIIDTHVTPGVFHWPKSGQPEDGTCIGNQSICFIEVFALGTTGETTEMKHPLSETYDPENTTLIINDGENPISKPLSSMNSWYDEDGNLKFNYK